MVVNRIKLWEAEQEVAQEVAQGILPMVCWE